MFQPRTPQPPVSPSRLPDALEARVGELEPEERAMGLLLIVVSAAVLVGAGWTYSWYSGFAERKTQESLHSVILSKKATIEGYLAERMKDAEIFSRRESVRQGLLRAGAASSVGDLSRALQDDESEVVNIFGYRDASVVDLGLRELDPHRGGSVLALKREVFLDVIEHGEPRIVDLHRESDGTVCFGVAYPVFGGEPSAAGTAPPASAPVLGLVYLEMGTAARFDDVVSGWPIASESAETVLFRVEGEELLFLNPLRFLPDAPRLSVRRPLHTPGLISAQLVQAADTAIVTGVDYRGEQVIGAGTIIAGTTWHLLAKMDQSEALGSVRRVGPSLAVTALLSLLLMSGAGSSLWTRRRARFALEQGARYARYAVARNTSIDGYIVVNKHGVIVEANEAIARLSGYSEAELISLPLAQIHAMYNHEEVLGVLSRIREVGADRFRSGWRQKDGTLVHFDVSASYVPGPGGEAWHCFLHDVGPELAAQARIDRLNSFYVFLSHANAAVFNVDSIERMLAAVCEGAVRDAGFLLVWAGSLDPITGRVVPTAASGVEIAYLNGIDFSIDATLPSGWGPTGRCLREQTVCHLNDFQSASSVVAWRPQAELHGIRSSAAVPIVVEGESVGSLQFYSGVDGCFEGELLALLEEVGHTVGLAWRAITLKAAHSDALQRLEASEVRLVRVLENSPIPTQVISLSSRKMRMLNQAHVRTFGYRLDEVPDEERWFESVYQGLIPLAVVRSIWEADLLRAIEGGPGFVVSSPELQLLRSDGRRLWMVGRLTVVNDDILAQWIDLTEIRRAEAELRANEQRFRGMIEHNLAAICVVMGMEVVYCNRRLSDLTGWRVDELVGADVTVVFRPDPEGFEQIKQARERLKDGAPAIELTLACHIKDGRKLLIGVHGSMGVWDGQPATVLTIQDVTERQQAEEKIAAYVQQLEGAVQSTLTAVAKMLDMRDPYTAGHERRVGLIAADIAKEMGWDEARCYALNLAGLVHDIGKIAVPAEILTKPTRLTTLEYEMVKTHAELGYEILKDVDFLRPVATVIRSHHERLDGSGYPLGLKGDQIPVEARVLAVADVLESMASHRPYRASLGIEAALRELEGHRDLWFDREVVDALLRLVRDRGYQLPD